MLSVKKYDWPNAFSRNPELCLSDWFKSGLGSGEARKTDPAKKHSVAFVNYLLGSLFLLSMVLQAWLSNLASIHSSFIGMGLTLTQKAWEGRVLLGWMTVFELQVLLARFQ